MIIMHIIYNIGKTGAFCLPIIQIVYETLKDISEGKGNKMVNQSCKYNQIIMKVTFIEYIFLNLTAPHCLLSFFDRGDALAVTPDGLRCQSREFKEWHGGRATKGVFGPGVYCYEASVADEGLCRIGWSTQQVIMFKYKYNLVVYICILCVYNMYVYI